MLRYGDVLNIPQADERNRIVERKEVSLFNAKVFTEAVINAFVHNKWVDGNDPMFTSFRNRIEILSRGTLPPKQTVDGFYAGESVPVNEALSKIFIQLHITEHTGRGIPQITSVYGRDNIRIKENNIVVTIPFDRLEDTTYISEIQDDAQVKSENAQVIKAQEIFQRQRKTKKVVPKTYPLYRKVKCGTCGRAMTYKTYSFRDENYKYFGCPHAKEQVGEDGCCKRYVIEENLNAVVWSVVRQLLDMTDAFKKKLDKQNNVSRQDNLLLAEKLARLQQEKEKCESDRFANVDQFMAGQLDKEVYQRRRADLGRLAEKLDADIAELEQKLKVAETVKDDSLSQAFGVMKKYSGADELTQAMVQDLIEKVIVTDPEHVEIVWKFKDEVRKFIGI